MPNNEIIIFKWQGLKYVAKRQTKLKIMKGFFERLNVVDYDDHGQGKLPADLKVLTGCWLGVNCQNN